MAVSRPFWTLFSPFFRCFIRLDVRNPASGAKRPGPSSVTVQNGRQKSGRRRSLEEWAVQLAHVVRNPGVREVHAVQVVDRMVDGAAAPSSPRASEWQ